MEPAAQKIVNENFSFASSVIDDVWHPNPSPEAYEWWYFDALSEDGRDAVVIIFLDNFLFSPRYNKLAQSPVTKGESRQFAELLEQNPQSNIKNFQSKVPAVVFVYYRDGNPVYRAINEFSPDEFSASSKNPECRIGNSSFNFQSAPYGSGYFISINAKLHKNKQLEAHFEWLSIESNFLPDKSIKSKNTHHWNLVAPRTDVTGRISVVNENGKNLDVVHFRGTGYHDHNLDNRWLPKTVCDWQWGRAHFSDSTAVFYRYKEHLDKNPTTKLFTVRNGELRDQDAFFEEQQFSRDFFGVKYPQRLTFITEDNTRLRVKQTKIIDSSFFYLRFLSEMTLTLRDGKPRKTIGITEYLAPKALKYRWLDWLVNMRIGRNGKGAFIP